MSPLAMITTNDRGRADPMLEFAKLHFREAPYKKKNSLGPVQQNDQDNWKQQLDMIKWTKSPIQASLLKFDPDRNKAALESFKGVMQCMGDYPMEQGQDLPVNIKKLLKTCHDDSDLTDEIYCQLAKQTCHNNSMKPSSNMMGWRLLSIITAFFKCSVLLRPYLQKYIEQHAFNPNDDYQMIAQLCLQNMRQTLKYGGRKNVPSDGELLALSKGRNLKRQICFLPGGFPVNFGVRTSTVVVECMDQIFDELGIQNDLEREEYTVFYVIEDDCKYCPLKKSEYLLDITADLDKQKKKFYLLFQRTSWFFPLHLGNNSLYVEAIYHQVIPDYIDGFFLMVDGTLPRYLRDEIAMLTAYQYRGQEKPGIPTEKELKTLIPKLAESSSDINMSKWTNLITEKLQTIDFKKPVDCHANFLELINKWPLFGSTFFTMKGAVGPGVKCGEALISINRIGVHILEPKSHKPLIVHPYEELITSRRHKDDRGRTYLDLKYGDLRVQKVTTIETDQAAAMNTLLGQYFNIRRKYRLQQEGNNASVQPSFKAGQKSITPCTSKQTQK